MYGLSVYLHSIEFEEDRGGATVVFGLSGLDGLGENDIFLRERLDDLVRGKSIDDTVGRASRNLRSRLERACQDFQKLEKSLS